MATLLALPTTSVLQAQPRHWPDLTDIMAPRTPEEFERIKRTRRSLIPPLHRRGPTGVDFLILCPTQTEQEKLNRVGYSYSPTGRRQQLSNIRYGPWRSDKPAIATARWERGRPDDRNDYWVDAHRNDSMQAEQVVLTVGFTANVGLSRSGNTVEDSREKHVLVLPSRLPPCSYLIQQPERKQILTPRFEAPPRFDRTRERGNRRWFDESDRDGWRWNPGREFGYPEEDRWRWNPDLESQPFDPREQNRRFHYPPTRSLDYDSDTRKQQIPRTLVPDRSQPPRALGTRERAAPDESPQVLLPSGEHWLGAPRLRNAPRLRLEVQGEHKPSERLGPTGRTQPGFSLPSFAAPRSRPTAPPAVETQAPETGVSQRAAASSARVRQ